MTSPLNTNAAANDAPVLKHASSDEEDVAFLRKAQLKAEEAQKCVEELVAAAKLRNDEIDHRKKAREERKREEEKKRVEAKKKREADEWEAKRIANAKAVEAAEAKRVADVKAAADAEAKKVANVKATQDAEGPKKAGERGRVEAEKRPASKGKGRAVPVVSPGAVPGNRN